MTAPRQLMSRAEAAAYLGLSPFTLDTWACRGSGPTFYKLGRRAMYRLADLEAWLQSHQVNPLHQPEAAT